jgi:hypothetical protein
LEQRQDDGVWVAESKSRSTAKRMIEDSEFYRYVTTEDRHLKFTGEIDYLTGIQRKNVDLVTSLSEKLSAALSKVLSQAAIDPKLTSFDTMRLDRSLFDSFPEGDKDSIVRALRAARLRAAQREELHELAETQSQRAYSELDKKESFPLALGSFLGNFMLTLAVIRNCELIDDKEFKRRHLNELIEVSWKFLYFFPPEDG